MKLSRTITETVETPSITKVQLTCDGQGRPISVSWIYCGESMKSMSLDAEIMERLAAIVRSRRFFAGNFSVVCPDHGYHEGNCPGCAPSADTDPLVDTDLEVKP